MYVNKNVKRGAALYINNKLNPQEVSNLNDHTFEESTWCSIERGDQKLLLGTVYRSPNSTDENNELLLNLLEQKEISENSYNKVCIMGDFNYPNIDWSNRALSESGKGSCLQDKIDDILFFQKVENNTRHRQGQKSNMLDLIIVNDEDFISTIKHSSPLGNSDHEMLQFSLYMPETPTKVEYTKVFNMKKGNYDNMRKEIAGLTWQLTDKSTNEIYNNIKDAIHTTMEKNIPKTRPINKKKKPRWLDKKIMRRIKKKHKLFKRYLLTKEGTDYVRFMQARRRCKKAIKSAKRKFERNIAKHSKTNPKQFWNYVNGKLKINTGISPLDKGDGTKATSDIDKANELNKYFASVFTKENMNNIPKSTPNEFSKGISISEIRVTPEAVANKLSKIDPTKAQGPDKIPSKILKELGKELSYPISILFNTSLETGEIPEDWLAAEVIAIYKRKGNRSDPANYRPVSLTCILCKILEDLIRDAIVDHMTEYNLYSSSQHGFRKQRSCMSQLIEVMDNFTQMIEDGHDIDIIYLDFKKAFDSVPHERLLNKLSSYGIQGNILTWIRSFLSNRVQRVRVGGAISPTENVVSGIPQGSILGPILFTIFINDLPDSIESECKIFADDTKIYNNPDKADTLQEDLNKLQNWSQEWQLGFNVSKCKALHIGLKNPNLTYKMKNNNISQEVMVCEEEKDLGVTFDKKLNFSTHIDKAINTAKRVLSMSKRAFKYLDKDSIITIYKALIRPHLEYGNIIWSPIFKKHSIAIEKIQRQMTKRIPGLKEKAYETRLKILNLPSLKHRRRRGDLIETYKILNGFVQVNNVFTLSNNDITRNNSKKIFTPYCKKTLRQNFLTFRVARRWNKLSENIVTANTTNKLKNLLDVDEDFSKLKYEFDK